MFEADTANSINYDFDFFDTSTLNASAANAISGGLQLFSNNSSLNASAANAVNGGTQGFLDRSKLNASTANAISGGIQDFSSASTLNASAATAISGGTQRFFGASKLNASTANAISGGTQLFSFYSSLDASAANAISGGTQEFSSGGILNASAANAISGGMQVLGDYGLLQIGATNALTANTQLVFSDARSFVELERIGGTLALNGYSTVVGKIQSGSLAIGSIVNNGATDATLTVDGTLLGNSTFLGIIADGSGAGKLALIKTGVSTLALAGNNTYTGATTVKQGALVVNGTVGGQVTVQNGATLMGSGSVGTTTLESGAIIAPGNSIGTLTINGDLTFNPGSTYHVEADPNSDASDRIIVNGTAHLNGGSVVRIGPDVGFSTQRQYTILRANALDGTFNAINSNYEFLDPQLRYTPTTVTLQLGRKSGPNRPIAFADVAKSSNQRGAANGLDSLPASSALHEYVLTLPTGAAPAVFDNLSGEIHASTTSALLANTAAARNLPMTHLRANLNAGMRPGAVTAQASNATSATALPTSAAQPAWAELIGSWQTLQSDGNAAQVRQRIGGLFVGSDHAVGAGWRLGGALGYTDSTIRVDDRASKADVSSYSATIYGGKSFETGAGKLNFLAGAGYTWHNIGTNRYAQVAGSSQKLTADYGASTSQLFTELGYAVPLSERTTLEPFAGLAWNDLRTRGFSESGGSAALSGQSGSDKQTSTTLGVRAQTAFLLGQSEGKLRATLGWRHAFGEVTPQSTMAFDGGQAFTVAGAPIARNAALAELGADIAISRNATVGLNYSGQYGGGNREHAGSVNVRWLY